MAGPSSPTLPLPPGFCTRPVIGDPWACALEMTSEEPGTVFWNGSWGRCRAAILFAPDRPVTLGVLCGLGLLALFDATAGLAPPQVPVAVERPDRLLVNGGLVATVRAEIGSDWALLGFDAAIDLQDAAPGETPGQTCLAEEGFEPVTQGEFLLQVCRHMLRWLEIWREDGPDALLRQVTQRTAPAGVIM